MNHVFTKKHDSYDNELSLLENNSSISNKTFSNRVTKSKIDFPETQVSELSKVKDIKTIEDKIVTYNHISSNLSKETRFCRYHIPFPKSEERIPRDLDILFPNLKLEMHELKHVKEIPSLLKLINYKLYYSYVTKLTFLHTIEHIPHQSNLERINNEFILDLYRSLLDEDMESVYKQFVKSCGEYLQNSQADLKNDFNIDLTEYDITSTTRKQQIKDLMKNPKFLEKLYQNFDNFINSIDFTNRDIVDDEISRTIYVTTSDEYKSRSFNRLIPVKFPLTATIFDSSFVENNKTLNEPFYPSYGLYPSKNGVCQH